MRQKLLKTTNQGLDGQKTTKKKTEGIDNADKKKIVRTIFLSGHKGIYHQVEFYHQEYPKTCFFLKNGKNHPKHKTSQNV